MSMEKKTPTLLEDIERCDRNMMSVHPAYDWQTGEARLNPEGVADIEAFKRVLSAAERWAAFTKALAEKADEVVRDYLDKMRAEVHGPPIASGEDLPKSLGRSMEADK